MFPNHKNMTHSFLSILGYFSRKNRPAAYMRHDGVVVLSNSQVLRHYPHLGKVTKIQLQEMFSNKRGQRGGGGFFGESNGICGWGNHPSCCFTACAPLWQTSLWPISNISM